MGIADTLRYYFGLEERGQTVNIPRLPFPPETFLPWVTFNGNQYGITGLNQTLLGDREEIDTSTFNGLVQHAYQSNGIVFAVMLTRLMLFSQARFQLQQFRKGRPDELFGDARLEILERPWTNGTTADLLARAITDADIGGNFYVTERRGQLRRLRPDWVSIVFGSQSDADTLLGDIEADVLGYIYYPGGKFSGREPVALLAGEVAHWAPIPDPLAWGRGMSWLTPVIREISGDTAATAHKLKFFENGATVNLVVQTGIPDVDKFKEWVRIFREGHEDASNAYKTLFLTPGADAKVVGADFQQMDFKATQGAGETRIAAAGRIHPAIVGLSEGLQGASLNAGNFAAARRLVADGFLYPSWGSFAGSMESIVRPSPGTRLWVDTRDVPFLREDRKDAADIERIKGANIRQLVDAGFVPDSVVKAVEAEDLSLLVHQGLYSVQLQPPQPEGPPEPLNGTTPVPNPPQEAPV